MSRIASAASDEDSNLLLIKEMDLQNKSFDSSPKNRKTSQKFHLDPKETTQNVSRKETMRVQEEVIKTPTVKKNSE